MARRTKKTAPFSGKMLVQIAVMVAAALLIYWPALLGDWLWDDDVLVTSNSTLQSLSGLGQIWFSAPSTDYWPLTWTLLWIEWHVWGNDPMGYHVVSLGLHILSGLLIWRLFDRLGMHRGWLGGMLFVIHPLAVESAAWNAEIKNTLSLPFYLLACNAWLDAEEKKPSGYGRAVLFYLAAMLAKTSTVMLPAVLLLYGWWKRGRITGRDVHRMVPFGAIALTLGLVTIYFQEHGTIDHTPNLPAVPRLIRAGMSLCFYLGKFILPLNLMPNYPKWNLDPPSLLEVLTLPALAALLGAMWIGRKGWGRHALLGFGFFLLNALPVLGLTKMSYFRISWVADHLVYLPVIGLVGLVVAGGEQIYERISPSFRFVGVGVVAFLLAWLTWESRSYAGLYVDQETEWTYTLERNPQAWLARNNLGQALVTRGRLTEAMEQFKLALQIYPDYAEPHYNMGIVLAQEGRYAEAIGEYKRAIQIQPDDYDAYNNLAVALYKAGRAAEAVDELEQVLQINPDYTRGRDNLARILAPQNSSGMKN